ncbi:uncharacterized protein LOC111006315 [Momordica charantia]|uniref:Uncharacterized protein LOC111006315 n=1 Tax=Momordica charantia TaxID=3673 RepID=A0A6J1BWD8_MOMCH|nr:uncharacterized protein LOC111006315 [Momordica charantia]XP_022133870.1 uncharacterized protein LOC111006315 [Momordica charantia]XP_022133871.1 uncharacterized protein LOC111006315 [Momordica charantia]
MDCVESFKQSKVQLEVTHKETDVIPDRSDSHSSCASDSSQESAVSSIFQTNPPALQPKPDVVESPVATQTAEDSTLDCINRIRSSSRGSSQIRLSGALGNHDPNRIPVSIFSGKPSNPMEWSTASNESLFSIHVGNNSFSRDHFNFFNKSGELMTNPGLTQNPSNQLPPFVEPARVESKKEITAKPCVEPLTSTGPQIPAISVQSATEEVSTPMDDLRGRHSVSNDSMNSSRSFQFPVLGGEGATPTTASSVSTDSCPTQQPVAKQQSLKQQLPEHQSPSTEATSASPTASSGWFSCFSWCRRR